MTKTKLLFSHLNSLRAFRLPSFLNPLILMQVFRLGSLEYNRNLCCREAFFRTVVLYVVNQGRILGGPLALVQGARTTWRWILFVILVHSQGSSGVEIISWVLQDCLIIIILLVSNHLNRITCRCGRPQNMCRLG